MDKKAAREYACPMHCEGDKVYQKPGDCSVCHMHLVPVDSNDKHAERKHISVQSVNDYNAKK